MLNDEEFLYSIRFGAVFYFIFNEVHETVPHYFVILNRNPSMSSVLVIPVSTTKIDKRKSYYKRHWFSLETLIEVKPKETNWLLKKDSAFDCNETQIINSLEFYNMYKNKQLKYIWIMPKTISDKLKTWVLISNQIENWIKELL
jgi:hypothetical protein